MAQTKHEIQSLLAEANSRPRHRFGQNFMIDQNLVRLVAGAGQLGPGDLAIEERLTAIVRWNALAMVMRANRAYGELGGHIASYASAAETVRSWMATPSHRGNILNCKLTATGVGTMEGPGGPWWTQDFGY